MYNKSVAFLWQQAKVHIWLIYFLSQLNILDAYYSFNSYDMF